ncbi:TIGR02391 family protein [Bradyrhizobium sp. LA7.1]|uniref:TIGR02391 family protein n=1 Tax=unclassified Bradyrhizobium TaxID=2631580 RepID=UPI003397CEAD
MARKPAAPPEIEPKVFQNTDEIARAIVKLERRIKEISDIDFVAAERHHTGADDAARSNLQKAILEIYGPNSPEYREHQHIDFWAGPMFVDMHPGQILEGRENGRRQVLGIISGLIASLKEKREDLEGGERPAPSSYFEKLNLHPRIADVARDLFLDGHHFDAVFAAAKALVNFVKERSGRHDLDGAPLMRTVFSKNSPALAFNDLSDQTKLDEQEGMMHLFEGAVLGIRNPGGHSFPEGTEQRAIEYISLLSLLAYRVQEAKKPSKP